jgi:uroporphyrinogen decarboxylase
MTHKERAIMALNRQQPDYVPTFELEYQLSDQVFGKPFLREEDLQGKSTAEIDKAIKENAEFLVKVYTELGHSIIPIQYLSEDHIIETAKHINKVTNDQFLLTAHGDGTFAIPDGKGLEEMIYWLYDEPEEGKEVARKNADKAIERDKKLIDGGVGSLILCSDYCFNSGPFLSMEMFEEFVQPYLHDICKAIRSAGGYAIKHTDGNIMPILDMLVECEPHALHSLDPMAGVDIKEVKARVGDKVALCGNVHCAYLQTGTDEQVLESCRYAMENGKPGGGYFFCTSNIPFKGMPIERYDMVLDFWRKNKEY